MTGSAALFAKLLSAIALIQSGDDDTPKELALYAPPGAVITTEGDSISCGPAQTCTVTIPELPYSLTINVTAEPGYNFTGWTKSTPFSCTDSTASCQLTLSQKSFLNNPNSSVSEVSVQPTVAAISAEAASSWEYPARVRWTGAELEGGVDYCGVATIRWDAPTTHFDINKDGVDDVMLHISCYQSAWPEDPNEPHNSEVIAAWKLFCSQPNEKHYDCTQQIFGSNVINTTGTSSGGGNPYTHVMNKPRDLNGDGYPEFWYALNRDDGRIGLPNSTEEEFAGWVKTFCGESAVDDCTRQSNQSMLISNPDGTYQVAFADHLPTNTQAVEIFPNLLGTFDMAMFNYGPYTVSRWTGTEFVDVTDEWAGYNNIDYAFSDVYVHAYNDSATDTTFLVTPNVPEAIAGKPRLFKDIARQPDRHLGFTVWRFVPGSGFELSDYYLPDESDLFAAKVSSGTGEHDYELQEGVYINGIPTLLPNYFHMKVTKLSDDGDLILFMQQENDGGTTYGRFLKEAINENTIYQISNGNVSDEQGYLSTLITPVQTFYINNGTLEQTAEPLIEAGYFWNTPGMRFADANNDGHLDLFGISGHESRGSIHLNSGDGRFVQKRIHESTPPIWFHDGGYAGHSIFPLNLDSDTRLDLMFWEFGSTGQRGPEGPGEAAILQGQWEIETFTDFTPESLMAEILECNQTAGWVGGCKIH